MRVGWLMDAGNADGTLGGAELTQQEFRDAAPDDVEVVGCPPGEMVEGLDRFVIHNCVGYTVGDLRSLEGLPVWKYHHDVGPHVPVDVKMWLAEHTSPICCSPLQAQHMGLKTADCIPPAMNLDPFREAANNANGRKGAVSVACWMNPGKAPHRAAEVAPSVDFYGGGPFAPAGSQAVPHDELPGILARYETFVFLPDTIEPFGRLVVEAAAAGLRVVTNRLVGSRYWLAEDPDALSGAADRFWDLVMS